MELPESQTPAPGPARAPARGLKLMIVIIVVFALLALYGRWERLQRPKVETVTILPETDVSPTILPNDTNHP